MKNSKLVNYLLILSLVICCITTSTNGVLAAKSTELNDIIYEYIKYRIDPLILDKNSLILPIS